MINCAFSLDLKNFHFRSNYVILFLETFSHFRQNGGKFFLKVVLKKLFIYYFSHSLYQINKSLSLFFLSINKRTGQSLKLSGIHYKIPKRRNVMHFVSNVSNHKSFMGKFKGN